MTKCKDCIHEQACSAWIRHGDTLYDDFEYSVEGCSYYAKASYGNWIQDGIYNCCSECHRLTLMPHLNRLPRYEFCPYCGTKMDMN